ncbi:MAG: hypothetical protein M3Q65_22155 [Chloroflexota bacterium]|nr:hypothetical protein [Chloroflexota bacterium]
MAVSRPFKASYTYRRPSASVSALNAAQRLQYIGIVVIWYAAVLNFASFWFTLRRVDSFLLYSIITAAFFYEIIFITSFFLFFLGRMRVPLHIPAPAGLKIAIITLCVPSKESIAIIERQIRQMVAVTYPHDSWVLDEENDPRVVSLCRKYGVQHFTRHGVAKWNQPQAPFQAKTKAGNVNAWLFEYGADYEFFVQMDIDHNPVPEYLDRVLGHFRDPHVAWVQAPSVYGNLGSWAARGSSEQNMLLHGPLQMGLYGFCQTPVIIGSHTTYRTTAMLHIGGMQPTRVEDHLDTIVLVHHGYRGVYVPERIATGDGPEDFETYLKQEFAWSYSMTQILLQYSRKNLRRYPLRTIPAFLFLQTWYPCWSFSMLMLFVMPPFMLVIDQSSAGIPFMPFLLSYVPIPVIALGICRWSRGWCQPPGVPIGWRAVVLNVARWPVNCWAVLNAIFNIKRPYMITPKGQSDGHERPFNFRAQGPYLAFVLCSLAATWWFTLIHRKGATQGYLLYTVLGILFMLLVFWAALIQDMAALRQAGVSRLRTLRLRARALLVGLLLVTATGWTSAQSMPLVVETATWNGGERAFVPARAQPPANPSRVKPILPPAAPRERFFGAYDPKRSVVDDSFKVEMFYISFAPEALAELGWLLATSGESGRVPLVTLEPWPLASEGLTEETLLSDVASGRYDAQLLLVADAFRNYGGQIAVRFAHEMEHAPEVYPWASGDPEQYIAAYRHVHDVLQREIPETLLWVWSPAGNVEAPPYYPGDDVVDYVGITILGSHDLDAESGERQRRSFVQLMGEKYPRAEAFGKPVIIAELGVSGPGELQASWLREMFTVLDDYPALRGLIYYNDYNVVNELVPDPPDYSITNQQWRAGQGE